MSDPRDLYIARVVPGRSFVDIGGLWGTINEKVTVAHKAGAISTAMLDWTPPHTELWQAFHQRCADAGVHDYQSLSANIDEPGLERRVGQFDVVHCSGVLYHCPNPFFTLTQIARLCRRSLILTTAVIPPTITASMGRIAVPSGGALFVPYLPRDQREVLREHWEGAGVSGVIGIMEQPAAWLIEDYAPWWWLFPSATARQLIMAAGFDIEEDTPFWNGNAHVFLAHRRQ